MRIVAVDPDDPGSFEPWHRAYADAELAIGPGVASPWQLEELRAAMLHQGSRAQMGGWSGLVEDRVVCTGWLRTPLLDNTDRAELLVHTVPDARRRGHASAMLDHVEAVARDRGRSILVGEAAWPHAVGAHGSGQPGPAFALARGYDLALGDVKRLLRLPVEDALLEGLAAEAAPHHRGYALRSWVGPVPDDLLVGWARLVSSLAAEAPAGDLHLEAETADPAVVREDEVMIAKQGRTKYNTVAVDAGGEVVAYTDLATTVHEPGRAYQWGTLVRSDARGHRLGLAVKVANLRLLQTEAPDVELLTTYNAEVNRHMIEVNERLGFRPVARLGEFQKRL